MNEAITVAIDSGKWADKIMLPPTLACVSPLVINASTAAWRQKKLPGELFLFVERFIMSGGQCDILAAIIFSFFKNV